MDAAGAEDVAEQEHRNDQAQAALQQVSGPHPPRPVADDLAQAQREMNEQCQHKDCGAGIAARHH